MNGATDAARPAGVLEIPRDGVLALVLDATTTGIWTWELASDLVRWSPEAYAIHGLTREQFRGTGAAFFELVHPDDRERVAATVRAAIASRTVYGAEFRIVRPDGAIRWVMNRGRATYGADGTPGSVLGTITDVTEQRRALESARLETEDRVLAERRLRERESQLRVFIEHAPVAIAMFDRDLRYLAVSRRYLADYGLVGEDLIGRHHYDVFPQIPERWRAVHRRCLAGAVEQADADTFERADGATEYQRWSMQPWYGDDGEVGGVLLTSENVTERVEGERRLQRNAETFYQLVRNNPFGVYVVDADFRLAHVSRGSRPVFSNVEPLVGRDFAEVLRTIWPEPAATEFIERFRHTLATGEPYESPRTVQRRRDVAATEAYDWRIERIGTPDGRYGVVCYFYDLSERQRYESQLRESEATLRLALEAASLSLWHADLDADRMEVSDGAAALHGVDGGRTLTLDEAGALIVEDDRDRVRGHLLALRDRDGSFSLEYRTRWADGSIHWIATAARAVLDDDGRPTGRVVGTVRDLTEQHRVDAERERSRALLDAVLVSLPAGVVISDAHGQLVRWNSANEQLWGNPGTDPRSFEDVASYARCRGWRYPSGEPLGPHDWPMARSLARRERIAGELIEIEPFDGSGRKVALFMSAPVIVDGELVGSVAVQTDVTAQIRSERALEAANARLVEATRAAELGIHEYYPAAQLIVWDARLRDWWGLAPDEPVTYERFAAGLHPDDRDAMQAAVDRALDPGGDGRYEAEYRVVHPDGTVRWIYATGQAAFAEGRAVRLLGTAQDVSASRRLTEQLKAADRQKDVFLATLSHELRNPLAPVRTAAQLLTQAGLQAEQLAWAGTVIQRQVKHIALLLDDLLDIARVTQGKLALKRERVGLMSVLDAAVETARPLMERKAHRLVVALPSEPVTIDVDPLRLSQVLSNLLTNAGKYTDEAGRIELRAAVEGTTLTIEVVDSGVGLPPEALPTLFDMFTRVEEHETRGEGGLGLGLALVKGLVELHGGSVDARSEGRGQGSAFRVRLPGTVVEASAASRASPAEPGRTPGRRVLVVDDNRDGADALGMLLQISGHAVRVAYDGRGALALARDFEPEFALLDIGMPEMDGYALARALRAEAWARNVTLVALTGWGQEEDRRLASEAGFDHHLTKPVDPDEIAALLARVSAMQTCSRT